MIPDRSAVYRPVIFTGLVVVFYPGKVICLRVAARAGQGFLKKNYAMGSVSAAPGICPVFVEV
ncbi:MAG: hypothetical protein Q8R70_08990 [Methanoregula sp.]|nr:hypothetical protein [Methanoregula sp.]